MRRKIVNLIKKIYHWIFPEPSPQIYHHVYDARELFFNEHVHSEYQRYDIIVRLLAVENYYGKNDFGWDLYRKQQAARKAEDWKNSEPRFRALIKSYNEKGYDTSSEIEIGSDLRLLDGSHRMALSLYHRHYQIACQVMPRCRQVYYGINWYIENGFSIEEIENIHHRYLLLKEELQVPYLCTLWAPVASFYDEILERLKLMSNVVSFTDYTFDEYNYAQIARKIYAVDDIEKWKIEKKIGYMHQNVLDNQWRIRVVKLQIDTPRFRRKGATQNTLSQECEEIKRVIRNCYKDRLSNYFYDIICHIGDNFYQNEFINKLFEYRRLDVSKIIDAIQPYEYVLTKMDVPYIPLDFPGSYPLGKDMDVVCSPKDYQKFVSTIVETLHQMRFPYEINVIIKSSERTVVRVELKKQLIYQVDICSRMDGLSGVFTQEMIETRKKQHEYYIPAIEYELVIRHLEYSHYISKTWHRDFIRANIRKANREIIMRYAPKIYENLVEQQ